MQHPLQRSWMKMVFCDTRLFLRVDLNTPALEHSLKWARTKATIDYLLAHGNTLRIATHLGRPTKSLTLSESRERFVSKGVSDHGLTTKPLYELLTRTYPTHSWRWVDTLDTRNTVDTHPHEIAGHEVPRHEVLENLRAWPQETSLDDSFAHALMTDCQGFVHDAFGVAAHPCTSLTLCPLLVAPDCRSLGRAVQTELEILHASGLLDPANQYNLVLGGHKWLEKLHILAHTPHRIHALFLTAPADTPHAVAECQSLLPGTPVHLFSAQQPPGHLPLVITGLPVLSDDILATTAWLHYLHTLTQHSSPVLIAGGDSSDFAYAHGVTGANLYLSTGGSATCQLLSGSPLVTLEPF